MKLENNNYNYHSVATRVYYDDIYFLSAVELRKPFTNSNSLPIPYCFCKFCKAINLKIENVQILEWFELLLRRVLQRKWSLSNVESALKIRAREKEHLRGQIFSITLGVIFSLPAFTTILILLYRWITQ
jgi:hypothetical protein